MDIRIEKLTKGMGKTFADFFQSLSFSHEPHWAGCYCRFYFSDKDLSDWQMHTAEDNKAEAISEIQSGNMSGFLAFEGDECIGWLNANDWTVLKRLHEYIEEIVGGKRVGVTICYVIHPEYRSKGVAKKLLQAAIVNFKKEGYDAVLAIPVYSEGFSPRLYRGTISMYQNAGFEKVDEFGDNYVYWLEL